MTQTAVKCKYQRAGGKVCKALGNKIVGIRSVHACKAKCDSLESCTAVQVTETGECYLQDVCQLIEDPRGCHYSVQGLKVRATFTKRTCT